MSMSGLDEAVCCWAISDGAAGNDRQVLALCRALGIVPRVVVVDIRQPWSVLAPRMTWRAAMAVRDRMLGVFAAPWPDIAIGCGRRAALLTRMLRTWSDGATFTVQILDPRIGSAHFDAVITPQHDATSGANVLRTIGSLNPVDEAWLADGRRDHPQLARLPSPRTGVLVGATNRAQRIDEGYCHGLLRHCRDRFATDGGSFLVTVSRRTEPAIEALLRSAFATMPGTFWARPADGPNPYAGILGHADRIIVTPDSVNMVSEACATGRPVYMYAPQAIAGKLSRFHAELLGGGLLRRIGDTGIGASIPLRETVAVAELIANRYVEHRQRQPAPL